MKPSITLYVASRDLPLLDNAVDVEARNRPEGTNHLLQVSFPLDHYEIVPSVQNLGLFTVTRRVNALAEIN